MADTTRVIIPVAYNIEGRRVGGLDLDNEPVGLDGNFSPSMLNMVVEKTRVRKRQGYSRLGTGAAMSGIGSALCLYIDALGVNHLIALTTTHAYHYNATTDVWDKVTDQNGGGADVPWTGDADDVFSFDVVTDAGMFTGNGGAALCVVNGVDNVKFFEGNSSDIFDTLVHAFPSFTTCRDLVEFWNHLFFAAYTDTAFRARSLAVAGFANVDDWTSATSFATTLTDTKGSILRMRKLADALMIYSERSISKATYTGGSTLFVIPPVFQDLGLLSQSALCSLSYAHFFIGTDGNIYACTQGDSLVDIGRRVARRIFAGIDYSKKNRIAVGYNNQTKKIYFAIPTTGEDYPTTIYAVSIDMEGYPWEKYTFAHDVRAIAILRRTQSSLYCDDTGIATTYCDETAMFCDDLFGTAGADIPCFISSNGCVYKIDEASGDDAGSDIDCSYETEDIVAGEEEDFFRVVWFSFTAQSAFADIKAYVYYSTDDGLSWTELEDSPVTLSQSWTTHRLPLDVTTRKIRFQIYQSGFGDLKLRSSFKIEIIPSTSRD